jgi:hypothetical protein
MVNSTPVKAAGLPSLQGIQTYMTGTVLTLLLIFTGLYIMWNAKKKNYKDATAHSGISLMGLFWIGLGLIGGGVALASALAAALAG